MNTKFSLKLGTTLPKFIISEEQDDPRLEGISPLMTNIQTALKSISTLVRRAGLSFNQGLSTKSLYFEQHFELRVNELFSSLLTSSYATCLLLSPHTPEPVIVEEDKQGSFIVCFDPLDGISNIDSLVPIGTIFAIFKKTTKTPPSSNDLMQAGKNVLACGYALYGSATSLVFSVGNGAHEFILDPNIGEFIMVKNNLQIPHMGSIYSVNEGHSRFWYEPVKKYIESLKNPAEGEAVYSSRYIGSMVADVHRTIKYGGVFMYPATKECPRGKLYLMYECIPMAFLLEQCGGEAITFDPHPTPILNLIPSNIHQRTPIFLGSKNNIQQLIHSFTHSFDPL